MPQRKMNKGKKGPVSFARLRSGSMTKMRQSSLPKGSNGSEESPFDNVLRTNDFKRAERLVSIPNFLHDYPPRMSLDEFITGKDGNDGFSLTLCLLIESGVYTITADFLMHILDHFSNENIIQVLQSMKYQYSGSPKKVMHYALRRATRLSVPEDVSIEIIENLLRLGFDLNSLDDMNQSAIFYFVQGEDPRWANNAITLTDNCGSHGVNQFHYQCAEYKFKPQVWDFLVNVKRVKLHLVDKFKDTLLSLAVKLHRKEIICKLIKEPRFESCLVTGKQPPFHLYCEEGILCPEVFFPFFLRLYIMKALALTNFEAKTPLHCLLNNPDAQTDPMVLIPYLKKFKEVTLFGGIFAAQDSLGQTPLMTAICHSYPYDILRLLIPDSPFQDSWSCCDNDGFNALALSLTRYKGGFSQCNPRTPHVAQYFTSISLPYSRAVEGTVVPAGRNDVASSNGTHNSSGSSEPVDGEVDLHRIIEDLVAMGLKLDQDVKLSSSSAENGLNDNPMSLDCDVALSGTQSVLSVIMTNTHLTHRTINLLVRKNLFKVSFFDILECMPRFRLDILHELLKSIPNGSPLFNEVASHQSMTIEILSHVYAHRHRYLAANNSNNNNNNSAPRMRSSTNGALMPTPASLTASANGLATSPGLSNLGENDLSPVTQALALENLNRVCPLLRLCFDYFGHDVNYTVFENPLLLQKGAVPSPRASLLHALLQANSWLPLSSVVNYVFDDKGHMLNTEISVKGCGTPLNHAIRTGQFHIADRLLDLNADCTKVDLKITVIPLRRGFSQTIKRMVDRGARLPPEFGQQMKSITTDSAIESEYNYLMSSSG